MLALQNAMLTMKKIVVLVGSCCYLVCFGQVKRFSPLSVSIMGEAIQFSKLKVKLHPGIALETEFFYRRERTSLVFQTFKIFYYYHKTMNNCLGVSTSIGYRYLNRTGIYSDISFGIGGMYERLDQLTYKKNSNEGFKKVHMPDLMRLISSLAMNIGYEHTSVNKKSTNFFAGVELLGESPFNHDVLFLPHSFLKLGCGLPQRSPN